MSAPARILLGGVVTFCGIVAYVGWRVDQATRSLVGIGEILAESRGGVSPSGKERGE